MSALPIKARSAGRWSIGSTLWNRNGPTLHFGEVKVETDGEQHVFEVQVYLDDLDPKAVRVELYADGVNGERSGAAGDEARSPTGRRDRRLRL